MALVLSLGLAFETTLCVFSVGLALTLGFALPLEIAFGICVAMTLALVLPLCPA
jgi:hypothetical protein